MLGAYIWRKICLSLREGSFDDSSTHESSTLGFSGNFAISISSAGSGWISSLINSTGFGLSGVALYSEKAWDDSEVLCFKVGDSISCWLFLSAV